jgi:hypothetical protein
MPANDGLAIRAPDPVRNLDELRQLPIWLRGSGRRLSRL